MTDELNKYCAYSLCEKLLVRKEGEKTLNWSKRKTCGRVCGNFYSAEKRHSITARALQERGMVWCEKGHAVNKNKADRGHNSFICKIHNSQRNRMLVTSWTAEEWDNRNEICAIKDCNKFATEADHYEINGKKFKRAALCMRHNTLMHVMDNQQLFRNFFLYAVKYGTPNQSIYKICDLLTIKRKEVNNFGFA